MKAVEPDASKRTLKKSKKRSNQTLAYPTPRTKKKQSLLAQRATNRKLLNQAVEYSTTRTSTTRNACSAIYSQFRGNPKYAVVVVIVLGGRSLQMCRNVQ